MGVFPRVDMWMSVLEVLSTPGSQLQVVFSQPSRAGSNSGYLYEWSILSTAEQYLISTIMFLTLDITSQYFFSIQFLFSQLGYFYSVPSLVKVDADILNLLVFNIKYLILSVCGFSL